MVFPLHPDEKQYLIELTLDDWYTNTPEDIRGILSTYLFHEPDYLLTEGFYYAFNILEMAKTAPLSIALEVADRDFTSYLNDYLYMLDEDGFSVEVNEVELLSENFGPIKDSMARLGLDIYRGLSPYSELLNVTDKTHVTCVDYHNLDGNKDVCGLDLYCRALINVDNS